MVRDAFIITLFALLGCELLYVGGFEGDGVLLLSGLTCLIVALFVCWTRYVEGDLP
jgi:hypothetical protein